MKIKLSYYLTIICPFFFTWLVVNFVLNGGFFTRYWDDKIDSQVVWKHYMSWGPNNALSPEPIAKDVYGSYYKGEYRGIKHLNNQEYNWYIFRNPLSKPSKRFLEILLPIGNTNTMAILRTFDQYAAQKEYTYKYSTDICYVYLRYRLVSAESVPAVNPKFLAASEAQLYKHYHSPNYFSDSVFTTDYPSILDLTANSSGSDSTIRFGYKMAPETTQGEKEENLSAVYVCSATIESSDALAGSQVYANGCETWLWSNPVKTKFENQLTLGDDLERDRRFGHILTVPLDIITSPIQATVAILWFFAIILFVRHL